MALCWLRVLVGMPYAMWHVACVLYLYPLVRERAKYWSTIAHALDTFKLAVPLPYWGMQMNSSHAAS